MERTSLDAPEYQLTTMARDGIVLELTYYGEGNTGVTNIDTALGSTYTSNMQSNEETESIEDNIPKAVRLGSCANLVDINEYENIPVAELVVPRAEIVQVIYPNNSSNTVSNNENYNNIITSNSDITNITRKKQRNYVKKIFKRLFRSKYANISCTDSTLV
jgi:hypothetical protein